VATGVEELLKVVPRFVDRTRRQAEFTRSLLGTLACLGRTPPRVEGAADGVVTPLRVRDAEEPVDVLDVLAGSPAAETETAPAQDSGPAAPADPSPEPARSAPVESELGIQDYDSLAASQVVPRLATLSAPELRAVQAYERAHRHRQTVLNRVAQLLDG
jgi:hypothetical protein